jgi:hypothetical protein
VKRFITSGTHYKDLVGNTINVNSIELVKEATAPLNAFETMIFYSIVEKVAPNKGLLKHCFLIDKGWWKGTYVISAKRFLQIINLVIFK